MAESEPPTPSDDDAEDRLHCAIGDMAEERIAAPGYAGGGLIIGGNDNNGEPSWPPLLIGGHRSGAARWGNDVRGIGSSVADKDRGIRDKHITRQERRILPFPANNKAEGGAGLGVR